MKLIIVLVCVASCYSFGAETLEQKLNAKKQSSKSPAIVQKEFKRAIQELRESGIEQKALKVGTQVPSFEVGGKNIKHYYQKNFLIIKFYRGHWCPYCMIELQEYQKFLSKFEKKQTKLIALVPDTNKEIAKTKKRFDLKFPIFQDQENQIAKKFHIAFKLDGKVNDIYKKFGINLRDSQGNGLDELPLPGTYLINREGQIIYAFVDADYTKRLDPRVLLKEIPKNE